MNTKHIQTSDSLSWIKGELDGLIDLARKELVSYIEENQDPSLLNRVQEILHQLKATLETVEIFGAAILIREVSALVAALISEEVENKQNAYELLLQSMLMLPDYLEHVQHSNKETPLALLPCLNDLRTVRKSEPLSAQVLFFPALDSVELPAPDSHSILSQSQSVSAIAKRVRYTFELGLLGWFRGSDVEVNMQRMQKVFIYLYKTAREEASRRLWWIIGGVVQALSTGGLESSVTVKTLLGKVDRQIKILIDIDEKAFAQQIPDELIKNLLYYLAVSQGSGNLVREIRRAYSLSELLPDEAKLKKIRESISGPNAGLWHTVGKAIYEDLAEIKDNLEIFVSDDEKNPEFLKKINLKLHQISDTFAMLGLAEARKKVLEHADVIQRGIEGDASITDSTVLSIASMMLELESLIQDFADSRENVPAQDDAAIKSENPESRRSEVQQHKLLESIISEAKKEIDTVKDLLLEYIESPNEYEQLSTAPQFLEVVKGALSVAGMEQASGLTNSISCYISCAILESKQTPSNEELETLAEIITNLEYFLEASKKGAEDALTYLESGIKGANALGFPVGREITNATSDAKDPLTLHDSEINEIADRSVTAEPATETVPQAQEDALVHVEPFSDSRSLDQGIDAESVAVAPSVIADRKDSDQQIPVLSGDVDQEILEIFLEEAKEETETIKRLLPIWQRNSDNFDPLSEMRRSFHTLKGSGRLVGADLIGEFAWAFEDLLNNVLERTQPVSYELSDLLGAAANALPQLIAQLQGQSNTEIDPYSIIEETRALKQRNGVNPQPHEGAKRAG